MRGYLDGVSRGSVVGWAQDPERPARRIELEVYLNGELLGRCVADLERDDLRRKGVGDGRYGFRLGLPRLLEPGTAHRLVVREADGGAELPLADGYLADATGDPRDPPLVLTSAEPAPDEASPSEAEPREDLGEGETVTTRPPLRGAGDWLYPDAGTVALQRALGQGTIDPGWVRERVARLSARCDLASRYESDYLPAAMPPKAAVYPDHLPLSPERVAFAEVVWPETPAARLNAVLRDDPRLELLDLLGPLHDARRHGRVFTRLGTGLTWKGAFHAYRAIVKELGKRRPEIAPQPVEWLALGDLEPIADALERRADPELEPQLVSIPGEHKSDSELDALVLLEAPAERIATFVRQHFRRTIVAPSTQALGAVLEQVRPHVVIEILADDGAILG